MTMIAMAIIMMIMVATVVVTVTGTHAPALVVLRRVVGRQERASVHEEPAAPAAPTDEAHGVRRVAVLRARLGQVHRARLDVLQGALDVHGERRRLEPPTALVGVAATRLLQRLADPLEPRPVGVRQGVEVVPDHVVVARVVVRAQERHLVRELDAALGEERADARGA